MVFGWRRTRKASKNHNDEDRKMELVIPRHFICPISLDLMKDPVTLSSGITYDRESIESWLQNGNFSCPVTNQILTSFDQIPNHSLRKLIQDWCVENRNSGVERIPTPRIPISSVDITDLLQKLDSSVKVLDKSECSSLVQKMKKWSDESELNRRSIIAHRSGVVLASAFCEFSTDSVERNADILKEISSLMNEMMFPMDLETQFYLGSTSSLTSMVWFLNSRDFSSKHNSIITLKRLLSSDSNSDHNSDHAESLSKIEGVNQVLFNLIKDPISPTITKSSLTIIFHLLSSSTIKSEFVELGLIPLLLEIIVDSEKNICETALGVFDKLCDSEKGREEAYSNALTWPVLVKKILRVSELATEFSVSAIWKLMSKYGRREEKLAVAVMAEALQFGAFQKLVLLLQVGCSDDTKEKATELLKLMNPYRNGLECIDSVDFKHLKRSF
ncbi:U-box domain-containing protein 21-like [Euphorbia lathyris]|uniref:U-box domain-containing protein 21-like n=1 Tax=Euphorbia lathyris TaxID=212925 RepID=UPI003314160C